MTIPGRNDRDPAVPPSFSSPTGSFPPSHLPPPSQILSTSANRDHENPNSNRYPLQPIQRRPGESEDIAILRTFLEVMRWKVHSITSNQATLDQIDKKIRSPPYAAERQRIAEINNDVGLFQGMAIGMGTFLFLRAGPRVFRSFWTKRYHPTPMTMNSPTTQGYHSLEVNPFLSPPSTSKNISVPPSFTQLHHKQQQEDPKGGLLFRTIRFMADVCISLTAAAYGSFYLTDPVKVEQTIYRMPLIEGRSVIADLLCDDMIDVYRSIPRQTWENQTTLHRQIQQATGRMTRLMVVQEFVLNCIKRKTFEKQLLSQEQDEFSWKDKKDVEDSSGDRDRNHGIEIPSPGVPEDLEIHVDWLYDRDENKSNLGREDDFFTEDSSFPFRNNRASRTSTSPMQQNIGSMDEELNEEDVMRNQYDPSSSSAKNATEDLFGDATLDLNSRKK